MLDLTADTHERLVGISKLLSALVLLDTHAVFGYIKLKLSEVLELVEEEVVDSCNVVYSLKRNAYLDSLKDSEYSSVIRYLESLNHGKIADGCRIECIKRYLRASDSLHYSHLKAGCYRHYLTGCLHLCAELTACSRKLFKGPLGELYYNVVNCRLKASTCLACDIVCYLIECIAESDLCCDLCYRVSCRLTCKR